MKKLTEDQLTWLDRLATACEAVAKETNQEKAREIAHDLAGEKLVEGLNVNNSFMLVSAAIAARWQHAPGSRPEADMGPKVLNAAKLIEQTPQFARIVPILENLKVLLMRSS